MAKERKAKRARGRKTGAGSNRSKVQLSRPDNVFVIRGVTSDLPIMTRDRTIRTTARIEKGLKSKKRRSR